MYTRSSRFFSNDVLVDSIMSALRSEQPLVRQLAAARVNRRFALRWTAGEAVGTLFTARKSSEAVRQDARDVVIIFKRGGARDRLSEYIALQMVGIAPDAMLDLKLKDQPTLHTAYPELTPSWPGQHLRDPGTDNRCPWPGLEQLVLCYLNQDWADDWATPDDALIDYLTGTADDDLMRTLDESRQLLDNGGEGLLDEILWQMGCAAAYETATDVLQSLADRIGHHVGGSGTSPADRFGMGFLSSFHIESLVPSSGTGEEQISGLNPSAIWHELDDTGPSPFTPVLATIDALGWDAALDQLNAPSQAPLTSMIDVCQAAFEQDLSPELLVALSDGSLEAVSDPLLRFLRYYGQYRGYGGGALSVPSKPADELRPYIGPRISEARNRLYGRESFLSWSTPHDAFAYIDHLSVQLLYCHSLALRNPLSVIAPQLPGAERGYLGPTISEGLRARLCSYLNFLHAVRELLYEGVIVLVEEPSWYEPPTMANLKQQAYEMKSPVTKLLSHDVMEVMAADALPGMPAGIPSADPRERRELVGWAVSELLFDLTASHLTDGALDLSLSRAYFERVLGWLCDPQRSAEMNDLFKVDDLRVLTSLANAAIPDLSAAELSARDIVVMRRNEETFDEWRNTLRRVCRALAALPPDAGDTAKRNVISEDMDQGAQRLRESADKDNRMRLATKALLRFSIGAIVSMIPLAEITKSTTETLVELLIEYAKDRDSAGKQAAAHHHYLLLTRARDS